LRASPDRAETSPATPCSIISSARASSIGGTPVEVRVVGDFDPAFAAMMRERPDAVLVSNDLFHQLHIGRIIELLAKNRLPGMSNWRPMARAASWTFLASDSLIFLVNWPGRRLRFGRASDHRPAQRKCSADCINVEVERLED
jgi:hypothetical protein